MTMISPRKTTFALVGVFSLGLAGLAIAMPSGQGMHGGHAERMKQADTNGDGVISQEEFQSKRLERFNEANADGGAGLTKEEFVAMIEARKAEAKARRQDRMFNRLDANGDGIIDEAEFAAKADKMFSRIDADGDGSLTVDELKDRKMARHHRGGRGYGNWGEQPESQTE